MAIEDAVKSDRSQEPQQEIDRILPKIRRKLHGLTHGTLEIHINDGRIVRLLKTESERLV